MCILLNNELVFRLVLVILLGTFGVIRGYYTRKAETRDPGFMKKRHRKETRTYERKRDVAIQDLSAIAWTIPMMLYILVPSWRTWAALSSLALPSGFVVFPGFAWVSWVGVALGVFSLAMLVWVHRTLGESWTATLEVRPGQSLITHGPYGRIRHPMYSASMLFMFSTGLVATDWVILAVSALTLIIVLKRIDNEERLLLEHFGDEYREYMKRTRRLLPRLRRGLSERRDLSHARQMLPSDAPAL
jgi:protein-S-isoprenylcysteine O-methyltransferase Ste14